MKTFKKVVVKGIHFINNKSDITQLMFAVHPNDLRKSGGYSNIGIQYEIDRGAEFYLQVVEMNYPQIVISETKIKNPTIEKIRELNSFPDSLKQW